MGLLCTDMILGFDRRIASSPRCFSVAIPLFLVSFVVAASTLDHRALTDNVPYSAKKYRLKHRKSPLPNPPVLLLHRQRLSANSVGAIGRVSVYVSDTQP